MVVQRLLVAANDNNEFRFYVYAWVYPDGRPFYVGKGNGRRDVQTKHGNSMFRGIVAKIRRSGEEPRIVRWHEGLRERDAFMLEVAYIKLFGRRDTGSGILANMTDGGDGVSGIVFTEEALSRMSESAKQYCRSPAVRARKSLANKQRYENQEERERTSLASRMAPPRSVNKTGFKGVSFASSIGKWRAAINVDGRSRHLGLFTTPEEAAIAYDYAAMTVWGEGACYLNLPDKTIGNEDGAKVLAALDESMTHSRQSIAKREAPARANSASGIKGVVARHGKWCARINFDGKVRHIGTFTSPKDAALAYDKAAIQAWGLGNCYLNHPEEAARRAADQK